MVGSTLHAPDEGQIGISDGWIVDMSGVAGTPAGQSRRIAQVRDFPHLCEPDGPV